MIDASFVIKLLLAPPINSIEFRSTDGSSLKFGAIFFFFYFIFRPNPADRADPALPDRSEPNLTGRWELIPLRLGQ